MAFYESPDGSVRVELKKRGLAALLSWLFPGAGQFYQGRKLKAFLFCVPVLVLYFVGFSMADGKCVYASFTSDDFRYQYFFQAGVGGASSPALVQYFATKDGGRPFFQTAERYPATHPLAFRPVEDTNYSGEVLVEGTMAPPPGPTGGNGESVLSMWHAELGHGFDVGTLYTLVAGLLNYLIIFDAFAGPAIIAAPEEKESEEESGKEANPEGQKP